MEVMSATNYLEEYRRKYQPIEVATVPKPKTATDVQTLLSRYLSNKTVSIKPAPPETSTILNGHTSAAQYESADSKSDDDIFDEDELDKSLLPTTFFKEGYKLTVGDVIKKDTQLADLRQKPNLTARRLSNPIDNGAPNPHKLVRRSFSSDGSPFAPEFCTREATNHINFRRSINHSESESSPSRLRRRDSNISNKSVESSTSNKSNISFKSDIPELFDEDFDFDFEIDLNSSKQSDSDSQKLFSQFQLDTDSQRDSESLSGYDEVDGSCRNCRPVSARSTGSSADSSGSLCGKCIARRTERHATIKELLESEQRYGKDLRLIKKHFHDTLLENDLLSPEEISTIFQHVLRLIGVSKKFVNQISDHLRHLNDNGDSHYNEAMIGQLICDSSAMFLVFEAYCLNYNNVILLIDQLRKDNELFNLFLEASQNNISALRRMDLKSFLMLPVQRIMKYPLLLKRLHKATSTSHSDRDAIEKANEKLTNILHHINTQSKLLSSMFSNAKDSKSNKRTSFEIALTKLVLDTLNWKHDEIHFLNSGKIGFLQPGDTQWTEKIKTSRFNTGYAVVVSKGSDRLPKSPCKDQLLFPKKTAVTSAALLIVKKGSSRLQVLGEPLYLSSCLISRNAEFYDVFEIQKYYKESFIIRPIHSSEIWYRNLKYYSMVLGGRNYQRRNALPNILVTL